MIPAPASRTPPSSPTTQFEVRTFAPSWGASVMGTSAVTIALASLADLFDGSALLLGAARVLLVVTLVMFIAVLGINVLRWFRHRSDVLADVRHPIKGGMTATLAGQCSVSALCST